MAGTWAVVRGMVVDPVTTAPLAAGGFLFCVMAR